MSDDPRQIKQVICVRHDLKMRRGKQIAQASHASMSFLTRRLQKYGHTSLANYSRPVREWVMGSFAKVCCRVNSEEELLAIRDKADRRAEETAGRLVERKVIRFFQNSTCFNVFSFI